MVTIASPGGHTSRPHLTGDVVYALGQVITQVPAVLGRRLDPRSGVNLTWGAVHAGSAHNAIPSTGTVRGTLRCLDVRAWEFAGQVLHDAVEQVVAPYEVEVTVHHTRGVPPVENDEACTGRLEAAARDVLGPDSVLLTEQSLGGEDFAWYLTKVPGAMARLGTRTPGGRSYDLHQGDLQVDERGSQRVGRFLVTFSRVSRLRRRVKPEAPAEALGLAGIAIVCGHQVGYGVLDFALVTAQKREAQEVGAQPGVARRGHVQRLEQHRPRADEERVACPVAERGHVHFG